MLAFSIKTNQIGTQPEWGGGHKAHYKVKKKSETGTTFAFLEEKSTKIEIFRKYSKFLIENSIEQFPAIFHVLIWKIF